METQNCDGVPEQGKAVHGAPPPLPKPMEAMPVAEGRRLEFLDVLRGFALGGIFLVNISSLKAPMWEIQMTGELQHGGFWNMGAIGGMMTFAMMKFLPLFAMLFGVGLVMQYERAVLERRPFTGFFLRRSAVLMGFGILHAMFFWAGDVLLVYSVFAVVGLAMVKMPAKVLFFLSAGLMGLLVVGLSLMSIIPTSTEDHNAMVEYLTGYSDWLRETYREGTFWWIVLARLSEWALMNAMGAFNHLPYAFAFFLFGMFCAKADWMGWLESHARKIRLYFLLPALPVGLGLSALHAALVLGGHGINAGVLTGVSMFGLVVGAVLLSLSYAVLVHWLHASGVCRWLTACLAATGRMALTNYLLQSVVAGLLFMNYGLGLYGELGAAQGVMIVAVVYGLQLVISPLWLRFFLCGPFEWLWRVLVYGSGLRFVRQATRE